MTCLENKALYLGTDLHRMKRQMQAQRQNSSIMRHEIHPSHKAEKWLTGETSSTGHQYAEGRHLYYAHSLEGYPKEQWQPLSEHLTNVSTLAAHFAEVFGAPKTACLLGKLHDLGKATIEFLKRLAGGARVDHATAGVVHLMRVWSQNPSPQIAALGTMFARFLAYPLLGHHGGMPDVGSEYTGGLEHRLAHDYVQSLPHWDENVAGSLVSPMDVYRELLPLVCREGKKPDPFCASFAVRMLFSCLVDADYLDTENFCTPEKGQLRKLPPTMTLLAERLEAYLRNKSFLLDQHATFEQLQSGMKAPCGSPERRAAIAIARRFILEQCGREADSAPGLFSLTVPTGGGKTLSSLFFAIRHAQRHGLQRIIYVVPYTSIIEQNAQVFREALGDDAVLEHHSNFVHPEEEGDVESSAALQYRLSTENWQASVIVTTSVQFFESLFSCKPSRCRKLHNIAGSVVILDEVQMLPVPFVAPCVEALQILAQQYRTSIVLCTATQPALLKSPSLPNGFTAAEVRSLIPANQLPALFTIFERAQSIFEPSLSDDELVSRLESEQTVLCILNSRKHARKLFEHLGSSEENFHLSAYMAPSHRSKTLQRVKERLVCGLPCRLISTSLIECGVDISFPVVYRERNGLDVIAQSAGRCNRHGERSLGRVHIFDTGPVARRATDLLRRLEAFSCVQDANDLFSPQNVQRYFQALYSCQELLDEQQILHKAQIALVNKIPKLNVDFASIDNAFSFIGNQMDSVVIESLVPETLLRLLRGSDPLPAWSFHRLQQYSVQVYPNERETMTREGRIECLHGCIFLLSGGIGYREATGLDVTLTDGISSEELIF